MIIEDNELMQLKKYIPNLLKRDLYKNRYFECCPHCGSVHFIRNGYYNGIQRYKCHGCKRTFSKTTNSLWYYSKKESNMWVKYTELFLEKKSLRYCSESLKINLSTAFFWRHKIMSALNSRLSTKSDLKPKINRKVNLGINKRLINKSNRGDNKLVDANTEFGTINPQSLKGDVFLTYGYFQENINNSIINFKMDFYRTQKRIYVAAARGKDDSMIVTPISRHHISVDKFIKKVFEKIDIKSYIVLYGADHLYHITQKHNKRLKRKTVDDDTRIMKFQDNANKWFSPFHGISTKYLESYIGYFILYNLDKSFKTLDFIYSLIRKIDFIKTSMIKYKEISL